MKGFWDGGVCGRGMVEGEEMVWRRSKNDSGGLPEGRRTNTRRRSEYYY